MTNSNKLYEDELTEATDEREEVGVGGLPSEAQLVLLCLDYLRDLYRTYSSEELELAEGLDANYLSVAIYSLSRCFVRPAHLRFDSDGGNDAWMDRKKTNDLEPGAFSMNLDSSTLNLAIPDLRKIKQEIIYSRKPQLINLQGVHQEQIHEMQDPDTLYEYNDLHPSNSHRFYPLNGLASGPALNGPLTLGEIAAAGLAGLGARSRLDAEKEMITSPLFQQFVDAVRQKGFFRDPDTEGEREDPEEEMLRQKQAQANYQDRYLKVVHKFRTKLATKAQADGTTSVSGNLLALSAADRQRRRRERRIALARTKAPPKQEHTAYNVPEEQEEPYNNDVPDAPAVARTATSDMWETASMASTHNQIDLEEAERLKSEGNVAMQNKQYEEALEAYTMALNLSPAGPQSHVYFSNRAAALLSLKRFEDAIVDSERSLALKPDYGKAHSRLGLAHFLLGNYRQATEAYAVSLQYEPDNKSSKNYLEKAAKRLAKQEQENEGDVPGSSYSVVSEWDRPVMAKSSEPVPLDESSEANLLANQKEAEKYKTKGNSYMASRDYEAAMEAYTTAIVFSKNGPNSHIYYSNRAAALCYLERYEEAEEDSARSLSLEPTYGKAHARLGLSRFFMGDYKGAVDAYTEALEYDPNCAASRSYLEKAKARLERQMNGEHENGGPLGITSLDLMVEPVKQDP